MSNSSGAAPGPGSVMVRRRPEDFLALIEEQKRGRLKIYLGSAAGVGKTFEMLQEGNRLFARGVDVVIGYVEPHPRPETTAQMGIVEVIPPKRFERGGIIQQEMDVDAILARKPMVALVDELAHTNVEGSRNAKRYQDVQELINAGIHVVTTLNVQHVESVYDLVADATRVQVRERIPDEIVERADQIVNVDLPAEDLIERLKAGKIYPAEQAARALENFFTVENLTFLRELALNETAKQLDHHARHTRKASAVSDTKPCAMGRVMVGLSSGGPNPQRLLRKTARLADRMHADWFAVYVRTPKEDGHRLPGRTYRMLSGTLELAQQMGGSVVVLKDHSPADALTRFAREQGITHFVVGHPRPRGFWARFQPSFLDQIVSSLPDVDVVVA